MLEVIKQKKNLLILIGLLVVTAMTLFLVSQRQILRKKAADIATIHLESDPVGNIKPYPKVGEIFPVYVLIDSTVNIVAGNVLLYFDPSLAQVEQCADGSGPITKGPNFDSQIVPNPTDPGFDNTNGKIRMTNIIISGNPLTGNDLLFGSVCFRALQQTNNFTVDLEPQGIEVSRDIGGNIFSYTGSSGITIIIETAQILDKVWIEPHGVYHPDTGITDPISAGSNQKIGFSALASDPNNQPIWSGIEYEWWISSTNTIGSVEPTSGKITTFTARSTPGRGFLMVTAYQNRGQTDQRMAQKAVEISVVQATTPTASFRFRIKFDQVADNDGFETTTRAKVILKTLPGSGITDIVRENVPITNYYGCPFHLPLEDCFYDYSVGSIDNIPLPEYQGMPLHVFIKGPAHLQRKLGTITVGCRGENCTTECLEEIEPSSIPPTLPVIEPICYEWHLNSKRLPGGDADLQNGVDLATDFPLWRLDYLQGSQQLALPPSHNGDFNFDGIADIANDFVIWRNTYLSDNNQDEQ